LQLISLTSLKTWGSSSLSQLLTSEFERSGSTGSCCKISIDMVEDCCWLAGSSKDLQLWSDLQCFETLMMQAFYRRCCMQQGKEKDQQNGRCVWFLLTPFPQLPQFIELWINLLPLFELCRTSGCKTPEGKDTTLSSPFQYKIVCSSSWRFFGWLHHSCLQCGWSFWVGCIAIQEKPNNLAEFW
jgi:hypothetical protein